MDAQWRRRCLGGATGHLGGKFARREGRWNIGVDLRRCTHLRTWHTHNGVPYQMDVLDDLVQLMEQIVAGEIHLELEQVYPFADALAALAKVQTRRARGKLALRRE